MNEIKVEIVADSINQQEDRLTSLVLTYPRIIHAELLTHRAFSRNASSSRAVPVKKMIETVKNNTFCPFEFQKAHKGMQGFEYFTGQDKEDCIKLWIESAELALEQAEKMKEKGITKQIINRILEPYQYYTVLITGSKEGWDNFFELRNPAYETFDGLLFKSKKDFVKHNQDKGISEWSTNDYTDLEWLKINKGQAEIHIMDLAEKIYDAMNESTPLELESGAWHIPFEDKLSGNNLSLEEMIKCSVAMAARVSYTTIGDEKDLDYNKLIRLHDKLIELRHDSPLEHVARVMTSDEYYTFSRGQDGKATHEHGWCKNLKGFINYRYTVEHE